jgi:bifunctional isochorismate lyase/aryl carrier protein
LVRLIADCMELGPDEVPAHDEDLVDHGLHSVAIMSFVSRCHEQGIPVEFADLARTPTVDGWWEAINSKVA